jgi:hypothetical protein
MTDSASLRTRIPRKAVSTSSNITRARWTENEEKTIKQQLLSGKSPHEIQLPGRTPSSIRSKIRQIRKEIGPNKSPLFSAQKQLGLDSLSFSSVSFNLFSASLRKQKTQFRFELLS